MSITDGQWILDMNIFRSGIRPAVNTGLSVTRVGGVGHNKTQKDIAARTLKLLAEYRQAEEYSRFGSEMTPESKTVLEKGKNIFSLLTQSPSEIYGVVQQQLLLDVVLSQQTGEKIDVITLKSLANEYAAKVKDEDDFEKTSKELKGKVLVVDKK